MVTTKDIKRRLSLLELETQPEGKTHFAWKEEGMTEASYRKQKNIPYCDKVILIGWGN